MINGITPQHIMLTLGNKVTRWYRQGIPNLCERPTKSHMCSRFCAGRLLTVHPSLPHIYMTDADKVTYCGK